VGWTWLMKLQPGMQFLPVECPGFSTRHATGDFDSNQRIAAAVGALLRKKQPLVQRV
jgi:hypothetical protein